MDSNLIKPEKKGKRKKKDHQSQMVQHKYNTEGIKPWDYFEDKGAQTGQKTSAVQ